jgi:cAMP response element-binding protein
MDQNIVEENGQMDPDQQQNNNNSNATAVLTSPANIVQLIQPHTQSVIQPNQQSVIQTAAGNVPPVKSVLLVSKPNSVIHTTQGSIQAVQVALASHAEKSRNINLPPLQIKPEPNAGQALDSDDDLGSDDDSPKKRRDLLTRRPSYRKILNDLGGGEVAVLPAGTFQLTQSGGDSQPLHTITTSGGGSTIVQYSTAQDGHIYVPVGGSVIAEDQSRKREMRLLKNREAARECRRKKKEYIKCLENRVAVLENQNKALIEELKSLKELYCQQKNE